MNNKILCEYITVSIVSLFFGIIAEKIITYNNKNDNLLTNTKKKNYIGFAIMLIIFGCLFHYLIEYLGINKWQCEKKCYIDGTCELICKRSI
jgi:uncharacterized membrane protein